MAGTRELEQLLTTTVGAGGRVILVGDHHQLPEVTAGGAFAALATNADVTVAELTVNRRQQQEWERDALSELRDGHVAKAIDAYRQHNRVHTVADPAAMLTAAVDRWTEARANGQNPVLVAGTNRTVDALNLAVRNQLLDTGQLGSHVGRFNGRDIAVGDMLVMRANSYNTVDIERRATPLLNGHTATVIAAAENGVRVRLDHNDATVDLDGAYLAAGGVDFGYALTSHRAQGGTWDLAIAVGTDGMYREAAYLVMSRGRTENLLIVTQPELDAVDAELVRHDSTLRLPAEAPEDADHELIRRLNTSRAKTLAITVDPHADVISQLAGSLDLATPGNLRRSRQQRRATSARHRRHTTRPTHPAHRTRHPHRDAHRHRADREASRSEQHRRRHCHR